MGTRNKSGKGGAGLLLKNLIAFVLAAAVAIVVIQVVKTQVMPRLSNFSAGSAPGQ